MSAGRGADPGRGAGGALRGDRYAGQAGARFERPDVDLAGRSAPRRRPGRPSGNSNPHWEPSPAEFGAFVRAVATRYSGSYDPVQERLAPGDPDDLPRVSFWSIWNEPDYGPSLAPQGVPGDRTVENSPR